MLRNGKSEALKGDVGIIKRVRAARGAIRLMAVKRLCDALGDDGAHHKGTPPSFEIAYSIAITTSSYMDLSWARPNQATGANKFVEFIAPGFGTMSSGELFSCGLCLN